MIAHKIIRIIGTVTEQSIPSELTGLAAEPVPFHLKLPGRDRLDLDGARSVWYRVHGLLHFNGDTVTLEWSTARHIEQVSLTRVRIHDDATPPKLLEVPVAWIAEARLTGGWWAPRLALRARRLDAFDGVPGAKPGRLSLRIARRDRALAVALVDTLTAASTLTGIESPPELLP